MPTDMLQYLGLKPQAITYQSALQMYIKKTEIQAWTQINLTRPFQSRSALLPPSDRNRE